MKKNYMNGINLEKKSDFMTEEDIQWCADHGYLLDGSEIGCDNN